MGAAASQTIGNGSKVALTTLAGHKAADRSLLAATSSHRAPMLHTALHLFLHPFLHLLL